MPVITNKDEQGCYAQCGDQTKYYYECGNETQRSEAMKKAMVQGIAIRRDEGKLKREEKNVRVKAEQTKRADDVKKEIKKMNDKKPKGDNPNKHKKN